MRRYSVDGVEVPYSLEAITSIDPSLVGHVTLFKRGGVTTAIGRLNGNIREKLMADFNTRTQDDLPSLIMYSAWIAG